MCFCLCELGFEDWCGVGFWKFFERGEGVGLCVGVGIVFGEDGSGEVVGVGFVF